MAQQRRRRAAGLPEQHRGLPQPRLRHRRGLPEPHRPDGDPRGHPRQPGRRLGAVRRGGRRRGLRGQPPRRRLLGRRDQPPGDAGHPGGRLGADPVRDAPSSATPSSRTRPSTAARSAPGTPSPYAATSTTASTPRRSSSGSSTLTSRTPPSAAGTSAPSRGHRGRRLHVQPGDRRDGQHLHGDLQLHRRGRRGCGRGRRHRWRRADACPGRSQDAAGNRQGLTIAETGELGGPGMGGCPAGPADASAPAGSFSAVKSTKDPTKTAVTWTPAAAVPDAQAVTGYSVVAIETSPRRCSRRRPAQPDRRAAGRRRDEHHPHPRPGQAVRHRGPVPGRPPHERGLRGGPTAGRHDERPRTASARALTSTPALSETAANAASVTVSELDGDVYYTTDGSDVRPVTCLPPPRSCTRLRSR